MFILYLVLDFVCGGWALRVIIGHVTGRAAFRMGKMPANSDFIVFGLIAVALGLIWSYSVMILCVAALAINVTRHH